MVVRRWGRRMHSLNVNYPVKGFQFEIFTSQGEPTSVVVTVIDPDGRTVVLGTA